MSIFAMLDNHTFKRLDTLSLDDAMSVVERCVEQDRGYGFIGCKDEHGVGTIQWNPDDDWQTIARKFLAEHGVE